MFPLGGGEEADEKINLQGTIRYYSEAEINAGSGIENGRKK